ncbi:hypothetical protein ROZALSC1DRAFT_30544 [Rozella allomycis CSF55]|uniref:Uncharacterized protein n=1 Tax=Rozella allomycis (strain CSF55) TaxID=988480 RepID=A0A075B578_ROZAC|nr:hypothetical protein O9G_002111 [Rozella allomycis CSF55]RKP17685.1 hypothetical protein ROZALSC1DRAFT_30544 [Rozella allomycis CSF55]|eukprot:EPZ36828.1 hypothetical protein O9G_002111 [Rozella allomycis CSF55]
MKTLLVLAFACLLSALPDPNPGLIGSSIGVAGGIYAGNKIFGSKDDDIVPVKPITINANQQSRATEKMDMCPDLKSENSLLKKELEHLERLLDRFSGPRSGFDRR